MQSTGMCVCDAGALSQLFHHLHHPKEISPLLKGFEEVRQKRVSFMAQREWDLLNLCTMEKGEHQDARNQEFKRKLEAGLNALDDEVPDGNPALNQWEVGHIFRSIYCSTPCLINAETFSLVRKGVLWVRC